jgi:oxygen-independent coproporphyrinogen-3 oxidase
MTFTRENALGIYVSVPFCRSKCTYCNFASGVYPAAEHDRYVQRLIEDLAGARSWAARTRVALPRRVDSVYFGGGTPTLLAPAHLASLFTTIRAHFDVDPEAEITIECAPGQLPDPVLNAFVETGVNRVSLGVQSFIDSEASASGRLHNCVIVERELLRLRAAGIDNINVDLIAGLAGQTMTSWQRSLEALVASGAPHASVYTLEVDEDSLLGRELLAGGARYRAALVPSDDLIASMYTYAIERLAAAGIAQYEISNFSRPGFESGHNLRYWQRRPYLGVGMDASSMLVSLPDRTVPGEIGYVLRSSTTDDLKTYLDGAEPPETAWLSPERQHEEAWFLGLRLNAGVTIGSLQREFGPAMVERALATAKRLAETDLLTIDSETVRLTDRGRLLSNDVFQEFLAAAEVSSEPLAAR